jgi:hypothetical protein
VVSFFNEIKIENDNLKSNIISMEDLVRESDDKVLRAYAEIENVRKTLSSDSLTRSSMLIIFDFKLSFSIFISLKKETTRFKYIT